MNVLLSTYCHVKWVFILLYQRYQEEEEASGFESQFHGCNFNNRGGAFVPFNKPSGVTIIKEEKRVVPVQGLSLSIPVAEVESIDLSAKEAASGFIRPQLQQPHQQQQQRKQRRCWSPELHKRFVDALLQLGGAQSMYTVFLFIFFIGHFFFKKKKIRTLELPSTNVSATSLSEFCGLQRLNEK